jgi:hypothetical protein
VLNVLLCVLCACEGLGGMKTNIFISETSDHYSAGDHPKGLTTRPPVNVPLVAVLWIIVNAAGSLMTVANQDLHRNYCC